VTPQAKDTVQHTSVEASDSSERMEELSVRLVYSGEGMMPIVFILPAVIAFFFLMAMPPF
jgi:hypothetical protein